MLNLESVDEKLPKPSRKLWRKIKRFINKTTSLFISKKSLNLTRDNCERKTKNLMTIFNFFY